MVSFPPLIDMLKFSGYPYLIRGQSLKNGGVLASVHQVSIAMNLLRLEPDSTATDFRDCLDSRSQHQARLEG